MEMEFGKESTQLHFHSPKPRKSHLPRMPASPARLRSAPLGPARLAPARLGSAGCLSVITAFLSEALSLGGSRCLLWTKASVSQQPVQRQTETQPRPRAQGQTPSHITWKHQLCGDISMSLTAPAPPGPQTSWLCKQALARKRILSHLDQIA